MKSFDEWFKKTMPNTHKGVGKEKIETFAYQTAEDAWNFKQSEVDKLKKRIDDLSNYISSDDFIDIRVDYHSQVKDLINILKGENHES